MEASCTIIKKSVSTSMQIFGDLFSVLTTCSIFPVTKGSFIVGVGFRPILKKKINVCRRHVNFIYSPEGM